MLGFKSMRCARFLLAGIEVMHMIRTGQLDGPEGASRVRSEAVLLPGFLTHS
jgi:hypothetical protein